MGRPNPPSPNTPCHPLKVEIIQPLRWPHDVDDGFGAEHGEVGVQPYVVVDGAPGTILIYLHTLLRGHCGPQFARHSERCFLPSP